MIATTQNFQAQRQWEIEDFRVKPSPVELSGSFRVIIRNPNDVLFLNEVLENRRFDNMEVRDSRSSFIHYFDDVVWQEIEIYERLEETRKILCANVGFRAEQYNLSTSDAPEHETPAQTSGIPDYDAPVQEEIRPLGEDLRRGSPFQEEAEEESPESEGRRIRP